MLELAGGASDASPPCQSVQATTAQAAACSQKAADGSRRSDASRSRSNLKLSPTDDAHPYYFKSADRTGVGSPGSIYLACPKGQFPRRVRARAAPESDAHHGCA